MRRKIIEKVIANRRYRLEQFRNLPIGSEFFDWAALVLHKTEVRRVKLGPNSAEDIAGKCRNRMLGKSEVFLLCECAKAQSSQSLNAEQRRGNLQNKPRPHHDPCYRPTEMTGSEPRASAAAERLTST